jgi:hypothetical protein
MQRKKLTPDILRSLAEKRRTYLDFPISSGLATLLEEYLVCSIHTDCRIRIHCSTRDRRLSPVGMKKNGSLKNQAQLDLFNSQPRNQRFCLNDYGWMDLRIFGTGKLPSGSPGVSWHEGTLMLCVG